MFKTRADITLQRDITLPESWVPIPGIYTGHFYGNDYTITNLLIFITKPGNYGLFEQVGYGGGYALNANNRPCMAQIVG